MYNVCDASLNAYIINFNAKMNKIAKTKIIIYKWINDFKGYILTRIS